MPLPIYQLSVQWRGFCYLAAFFPGLTIFLCIAEDDGRNVEYVQLCDRSYVLVNNWKSHSNGDGDGKSGSLLCTMGCEPTNQ